jgi:hypothetical protein
MVESVVWTIDWNPEFEDEARLKREILRSLNNQKTIATIKRFAEFSAQEAGDDGLETEHILWLDSALSYAFFVRVWFDLAEQKLFILVEENDLGDVGFLLIEDLACASYAEDEGILKVEFKEPEDLGVEP